MQLEVKIDSAYMEPKVIILTATMTEDVQIILSKLSDQAPRSFRGTGTIELKCSSRRI